MRPSPFDRIGEQSDEEDPLDQFTTTTLLSSLLSATGQEAWTTWTGLLCCLLLPPPPISDSNFRRVKNTVPPVMYVLLPTGRGAHNSAVVTPRAGPGRCGAPSALARPHRFFSRPAMRHGNGLSCSAVVAGDELHAGYCTIQPPRFGRLVSHAALALTMSPSS